MFLKGHLFLDWVLAQLVRHLKLFFIVIIFPLFSTAQFSNTYFPILKNYKRSEYNAGMQTWMISQAPNDLMYFANNHGLVEFDGHNWELYGLYDYTIVRSVMANDDGKIYVGLSNNFGYFMTDSTGRQQFYSLMNLLPPDNRNIQEIWRIHNTDEGIVFQSFKELIVFDGEKLNVYAAPGRFYLSFNINNKLYVVDWENGILEFKNGRFTALKGTNVFPHSEICAILPFGKDLMIATTEDGIFLFKDNQIEPWETQSTQFLKENQIYCAMRIDENQIAFGTIQKGLLITDNQGVPKTALDKSNGLQNNTILSMKLDKSGNLWLGTDNGIDLLYINSPISQLGLNEGIGSGYTAIIHDSILYLGTNQGLFYKYLNTDVDKNERNDFKLINSTKGQVWNLQVIDDVLFCGHNKGAFIVDGENALKLGEDIPGVWKFLRSDRYPDRIIAGTYTGFVLFQKIDGKWIFIKRIPGFSESSRLMYFDRDENIWMSHGFKGVFHITLNETTDSVVHTRFYNSQKGFKNDFGINITRLQGQLVFLSSEGAFLYNEILDTMEVSAYYNTFFSNDKINNAIEDKYGNIWYYGNYSLGAKLIKNDGTYTDVIMPFKQLQGHFIEGFQFTYPIDASNFLISYENGFIHYNAAQVINGENPFNLYLNRVELSNTDSVIFKGHLFKTNTNPPIIDFKNNNIHFYFSAVIFDSPDKVEFSTFLKGHDSEWSNWQSRYDREFTNLSEGDYSFQIKARNIHKVETEPLVYSFSINPPWTRTTTAFILYIFIILVLIAVIVLLVRKRMAFLSAREKHLQQQKFIEREKEMQQEALIAEKEIIRLRNDQLSDKLKTKDKELANSTMETINKNKFLISLKKDLQKNNAEIKSITAKSNNKRLIRKIDTEINNEKNWQVFETHFGNVHEEFLTKLKQQHPQISPAELRLCACLRMNISSKEIASLLNISIRGVEASRYRLRRTLNLDRQTNLTDFILSL